MKLFKQKSALKILSVAGGLVLGIGVTYTLSATASKLANDLSVTNGATFNTGVTGKQVKIDSTTGNVTIDAGLYATTGTFTGSITAGSFLYSSSDRNLKENIVSLSSQLGKISQLQGVSFDWKKDGKHSLGLIAQEVEEVYPELVSTDTTTGLKAVAYGGLIAPLIEAVKEQQKQIDALKAEIENLKK